MIVMLRVDNGGRATAVVNSHYPKRLISIFRLDCVAGARTCLPRGTIKRHRGCQALEACDATSCSGDSRRDPPRFVPALTFFLPTQRHLMPDARHSHIQRAFLMRRGRLS